LINTLSHINFENLSFYVLSPSTTGKDLGWGLPKNLDYFLTILQMSSCNLKTNNKLQGNIKILKKKISPDFQLKKLEVISKILNIEKNIRIIELDSKLKNK